MIQTLKNPGQGLYPLQKPDEAIMVPSVSLAVSGESSSEIHKKQGALTMRQGTAVVLVRNSM